MIMTEDMNEEFLRFSEMLDAEDCLSEEGLGQDGELLLELRSVLRAPPESEGLPGDFAATTAAVVRERYSNLPLLSRLVAGGSHTLLSNPVSKRSLVALSGLTGAGFLCWSVSAPLALLYSWLVLLGGLGWVALERFQAGGLELAPTELPYESWGQRSGSAAFYAIPALAMLASGLVAGTGMGQAVEGFSRSAGWSLGVGGVAGLLTSMTLLGVLFPFWRASRKSFGALQSYLAHQTFYLVWLGIALTMFHLLSGFFSSGDWRALGRLAGGYPVTVFTLALLGSLVVAWKARPLNQNPGRDGWNFSSGNPYGSNSELMGSLGFYLIPTLAVMVSAVLVGLALAGLGELSLSFSGSGANSSLLGTVGGFLTAAMLLATLGGYWRAYRQAYGKRLPRILAFQSIHGVWLGLMVALVTLATGVMSLGHSLVLTAVVVAAAVTTTSLSPFVPNGDVDLKAARRRCWGSLARMMVPIALVAFAGYQTHLTTEISDRSAYREAIEEVKQWVEAQEAIPASENGYLDVRHFMLRSEIEAGRGQGVDKRLSELSYFNGYDPEQLREMKQKDPVKWSQAVKNFHKELPKLEDALKKPHFSTIAAEGMGLEKAVPNYILWRQISQGLALMTTEALEKGDQAIAPYGTAGSPRPRLSAVDYAELGLRWAGKEHSVSLIALMIRVAQHDLALVALERLVLEGELTDEELRRLGDALESTRPKPLALQMAMKGELYNIDNFIRTLQKGDEEAAAVISDEPDATLALTLLPDSYVESERKAYINLQLSQFPDWETLGAPLGGVAEEINPMNVASSYLFPNSSRAQAQFMLIQSRIDAHRLVVALERFRLSSGDYPDKLEELVPTFLEELPEDMIHPNLMGKKSDFRYYRKGEGYRLVSKSPVYEMVSHAPRQVYGHDGQYGLSTANYGDF